MQKLVLILIAMIVVISSCKKEDLKVLKSYSVNFNLQGENLTIDLENKSDGKNYPKQCPALTKLQDFAKEHPEAMLFIEKDGSVTLYDDFLTFLEKDLEIAKQNQGNYLKSLPLCPNYVLPYTQYYKDSNFRGAGFSVYANNNLNWFTIFEDISNRNNINSANRVDRWRAVSTGSNAILSTGYKINQLPLNDAISSIRVYSGDYSCGFRDNFVVAYFEHSNFGGLVFGFVVKKGEPAGGQVNLDSYRMEGTFFGYNTWNDDISSSVGYFRP